MQITPVVKCNCKYIAPIYSIYPTVNKKITEKTSFPLANYLLHPFPITDFIKMRREGLDEFVRKILGLPNIFNQ